ncbi:MAG: DEAD/DEAH box helicase [Solitalea-like symbiont of Acarus siro]
MNAFEELGLSSQLIKGIDTLGFTEPTSVQKKAIPELLNSDSDFICLAQTGTGKTAAFGLPLLHKISFDDNNIQSVILSPTRELCLQITKDLDNFSKYMEQKPRIVALYGGENINIHCNIKPYQGTLLTNY